MKLHELGSGAPPLPPEGTGALPGTTLRDVYDRALRRNAGRPALSLGGRVLTYGELDVGSRALADGLWALGVRRGDRVGLLMGNRAEYSLSTLAVPRAGAAQVALNAMLPAPIVAYMVNDSGARVVVFGPELAAVARAARRDFDHPVDLVQVRDEEVELEPGARWLDDVMESGRACAGAASEGELAPGDAAAIVYTGGTTGRPKGVLHSQRTLVADIYAHLIESEIQSEDRLLLTTPLPHAAGMFALTALVRGAHTFVHPGFDADAVLDAIERDRITWTFAVPTMLYRLLDTPGIERRDLSSMRTIVYGAAPIAPERLKQALEIFGPVFVQLYGQSECPNWITRLSKGDHSSTEGKERLLSSCGRACVMCDVKILDEAGREAESGVLGEVCVRSPYAMEGYYRNPEATAEKFVGGWMRTGDVGLMDEDGYVFLKDRTADMIISGGMNVYSTEVEAVVHECPGVAQVAVIGVPDPDWGEAVHAIVVKRAAQLEAADVLQFCTGRLAKYQVPKAVSFVDELPVTAYGKVDKKALRTPHWTGQDRAIH